MMNYLLQLTPLGEGFVILIVGVLIVFISLFLLFILFEYGVPATLSLVAHIGGKKTGTKEVLKEITPTTSGEEMAAVAAAIYLLLTQSHDEENAILTINKAKKDYSPWSSKIYMTHHVPPKQR
jgi:Na+-transporting methylmalonyl-CoA/oxaloacetate decarboxylase gamma subunit